MAVEFRVKGNEHFKAMEYEQAANMYSIGIENNENDLSTLLSNRAACYMQLNRSEDALLDCRAAIDLDPMNAKAYFRMAKLLPADNIDSAPSICAAVALMLPSKPSNEMVTVYEAIRIHHSWLPSEITRISCESNFYISNLGNNSVIVLRPRDKDYEASPISNSSLVLIGLGKNITIKCTYSHAIFVTGLLANVTIVNVKLIGSGEQASVCVCDKAVLNLLRCRVEDYADAGVLIAGGSGTLSHCTFRKLRKSQAVEVREGGDLMAINLIIEDCRKGFSIYGGAKSAQIKNCIIQRIEKEGIMVAGAFTNAPTLMQGASGFINNNNNDVSKRADEWGRQRGIPLEVTVLGCTISQCEWFGISADFGADVIVRGCRLELNQAYSILIKGGTNVSISGSQIIYSGKKKRSSWNGLVQLQSGIEIGFNYGGVIDVFGNAFCGPKEAGIVDEINYATVMKSSGVWSRPPTTRQNAYFSSVDTLPPIVSLMEQVPGIYSSSISEYSSRLLIHEAAQNRLSLHSISRTYPRAHWDPTDHQFYAIGNTFGYDVAKDMVPTAFDSEVVSIMMGACGDLRNVLVTMNGKLREKRFNIVLNDGNISMLARNAVLLYVMLDDSVAVEDFVALWASHGLTRRQSGVLHDTLLKLAEEPWPLWLSSSSSLSQECDSNSATETIFRDAFRSWLSCTVSLEHLINRRREMHGDLAVSQIVDLCVKDMGGKLSPKQLKELTEYAKSGSLPSREKICEPNVTLLLTAGLQYTVYFSSSIYRAVAINFGSFPTLHEGLLSTLGNQVLNVRASVTDRRMTVTLLPGDVVLMMTTASNFPSFDFMDFSNVGDYVSFPSLLQAAAPLLSTKSTSRIFMESIVEYSKMKSMSNSSIHSPETFANGLLCGINLETYEQLIGLQFICGYEINSGSALRMSWSPSSDFDHSCLTPGYLLLALMVANKNHLSLSGYGSPLTLVHLISLVASDISDDVVAAICHFELKRSAGFLLKWELKLHSLIEKGHCPPMSCVEYSAETGIFLLLHINQVIVLTYTSKPVIRGQFLPQDAVKQLLTSFEWDNFHGIARFLATENVIRQCHSWYITLCVVSEDNTLLVEGVSKRLSTLKKVALAMDETPAWWKRTRSPMQLNMMDSSLLRKVILPDDGSNRLWEHQIAVGEKVVGMDILSAAPFPSKEQAKISVSVDSSRNTVILTVSQKTVTITSYSVSLPTGVVVGPASHVKTNRSAGLLSLRFPVVL